jgi:branched-chain amino acid transport system substrate-binding protein
MLYLSVNAYDSTTNFLNTNQVPYMGWGTSPGWCGTRWGFGWNGCLLPSLLPASNPLHTVVTASNVTAVVKAAGLQPKAVRLAVQSAQNPTGIEGNAAYTNIVKATGGKTVYDKATLPVSTAGVDFTPYAQSIVASKPNLVILSFNFAAIGPVAAALKAAGYKGAIMDYVTYQPGLLASEAQLASSLAGEYITSQTPPQEGNTPWTKQEQAQLKAIGKPTTLSLGTSIGYTEANNLVTMLQAVGKNLNTKTFDQKINGGKYVSNLTTAAQGSPGKMIWPAAHFIPADCAGIVQVKGTGYKVASPFQCYPSLSVP